MIAGIRPQDLRPAEAADGADAPRLRAELEVVERLGAESHVIFAVDAREAGGRGGAPPPTRRPRRATRRCSPPTTARASRPRSRAGASFAHGEVVEFVVPPEALHLFDAETRRGAA